MSERDDRAEGFHDRTGLSLESVEEGVETLNDAIAIARAAGDSGRIWLMQEDDTLTLLEDE